MNRVFGGEQEADAQPQEGEVQQALYDMQSQHNLASAAGRLMRLEADGSSSEQAPDLRLFVARDGGEMDFAAHVVSGATGVLLVSQRLDAAMQMGFSEGRHSVDWIMDASIGQQQGEQKGKPVLCYWSFEMSDPEEEHAMKRCILMCLRSASSQQKQEKNVPEHAMAWMDRAMEVDTDDDYEMVEDDEPDFVQEDKPRKARFGQNANIYGEDYASESSEEEEEDEEEDNFRPPDARGFSGANSHLSVGMNCDKAFVFRDEAQGSGVMGVFGYDYEERDGRLQFQHSLKLRGLDGAAFTPSKTMLHEQDNKMLMLSENAPGKVYCMDLNRGEVVEEWTAKGDMSIQSLSSRNTYAQLTGEQTLVGLGRNGVFRMDPRVNSCDKLVEEEQFT
jgi:hypothetical protein